MIQKESDMLNTSFRGKRKAESSLTLKQEQASIHKIIPKTSFMEWLKKLSLEERYLALKVNAPGLPAAMRECLKKIDNDRSSEIHPSLSNSFPAKGDKSGLKFTKNQSKNINFLLDSLVLVSDGYSFHESVGFDCNCIQNPDKVYDALTVVCSVAEKLFCNKQTQNFPQNFEEISNRVRNSHSREEMACLIAKKLREQISAQVEVDYKAALQQQKNRKKEYQLYWKNLSEDSKKKLLFLGKQDIKELVNYLVDIKVMINPSDLEKQIQQLLEIEKPIDICTRIFKCKLKKSSSLLIDFHEMFYKYWKQQLEKMKKRKFHRKQQRSFGGTYGHNCTMYHYEKRKTKKEQRNRSLSVESNETTYTERKENECDNKKEFYIDIRQIIFGKLNQDIVDYCDSISDEANEYHVRRMVAFERIQSVLHQLPIKLFGSCANGITIKNSDIDIAIDSMILNYFSQSSEGQRVKSALEWVQALMKGHKWVTGMQLIKGAAVPVIKMKVDSSIFFENPMLHPESMAYLNRAHNSGPLEVDITIETCSTDHSCNHLGIISTQAINKWLGEVDSLRSIIIILKNYFTSKRLNTTYEGGLNTYSLIVMIIAFVFNHKMERDQNVAAVFESLIKFYGYEFDEKKYGIDIRDKSSIFYQKTPQQEQYSEKADLELKDPLNNGRVITKKCYAFPEIRALFRELYEKCFKNTQKQIKGYISMRNPKENRHLLLEEIEEFSQGLGNRFDKFIM